MTDHAAIADVLDDAADIGEREPNWCQGSAGWLNVPGDGLCLEGWLEKATGYAVVGGRHGQPYLGTHPAYQALEAYLGTGPYVFNDTAPDKQTVLDALRGCAKHERALADGIKL